MRRWAANESPASLSRFCSLSRPARTNCRRCKPIATPFPPPPTHTGTVRYEGYPTIPLRGTAAGTVAGKLAVKYARAGGCVRAAHEWTGSGGTPTRERVSEPVVKENLDLVAALGSCSIHPSAAGAGWTVAGASAGFSLGQSISISLEIPAMTVR